MRRWACSICRYVKMKKRLARLKPGVSIRTLLFLSAFLWSVIGALLLGKGLYRLHLAHSHWPLFLVTAAIAAGTLKSFLILDRAATQGINRILTFRDGTCLGAVYSVKTWILVLCMMTVGVILRHSPLPMLLLCYMYLMVGWALIWSSRLAWWAWFKSKELAP